MPNPKDPHADREARRYESPIASREFILDLMAEVGEPMSQKRLAKTLDLEDRDGREALQRRLRAMVRDGQLVVDRRNVYAIASRMDVLTGRIHAHPDGFGFLVVEDRDDDVYLSFRQMRQVFHGDIAQVRVRGRNQRGREEGEIVEVMERGTTELIGRVVRRDRFTFLEPLNNRVTQEVVITDGDALKSGQVAVVTIRDYPTLHEPAVGEVKEVLGDQLTPEIEIEVILRNHDIPWEFPEGVLDESAALPDEVADTDKPKRHDLRHLPLVTIDGEDARDFDDAVYAEPRSRGGWRLVVAIADVSHYVRVGTALDHEAFRRGTSVYFPDYVVPMLPEAISNGLCSLRPDVDRLALVCDMQLSAAGRVSSYQFYEAVIHSHARLTYNRVAAFLAGEEDLEAGDEVAMSLGTLHDLYRALLKGREQRGALEIDSQELAFEMDQGRIVSIYPRGRNDAHRLIEECMLCANVCAARFTRKHGKPGLYRVHEPPEVEKTERLTELLGSFGVQAAFSDPPTPAEFQAALSNIRGRKNARVLNMSVLRTLTQAVYQPENRGHFGLNYKEYAHFTSPIRRLADLCTHRLIKSVIHSRQETNSVLRVPGATGGGQYPYEMPDVIIQGEQASMTERRAEAAGYDLLEWLKCEFISEHQGDIRGGVVSAVTRFGLFVELDEIFVEGLVHVSNLPGEYFRFEQATQQLVGERSGYTYGLGDVVTVQVARVIAEERKIDLELVTHSPVKRRVTSASKSGGKKRQGERRGGKDRRSRRGKRR